MNQILEMGRAIFYMARMGWGQAFSDPSRQALGVHSCFPPEKIPLENPTENIPLAKIPPNKNPTCENNGVKDTDFGYKV